MEADLINKFSKYIKTIANRVVEVEFYWFQTNPYQTYRLRINEKQFNEAQKHIHSKKLSGVNFEQFTELITPIFANDAAEINIVVLQSSYDCLFDQTSLGTIGQEQFDSLLTLLHGVDAHKRHLLHENLRYIFGSHSNHVSFEKFYDLVKCGYLRELLMS